ncbi:unnamed protein product [Haemonchus placei]|uniref:Transposase n=1 Tax=Haemonchus placei TaxID=6290 RepID=A0A0N4VWZ1_HAEPC|nr:unnamed protein product [Haemonchus placei]
MTLSSILTYHSYIQQHNPVRDLLDEVDHRSFRRHPSTASEKIGITLGVTVGRHPAGGDLFRSGP